jgi:TPP-dependent pyruvate/acetoin dehydrogenase alpha subunit
VLFVCENNLYAMGTGLARHQAQTDIVRKAEAAGVPGEAVDGLDVVAVEATVGRAAAAVRGGQGPRLVEARTYRFRAHSMYDPDLYRDKDEIERWKASDPITRFSAALRAQDVLDEDDVTAVETAVAAEVDAAVAQAEAGPWEPVEDLLKDVETRPVLR